ncbi:MAG: hypothetical protein U9O49_04160 [Candidatus Thermoplasmatota archaeon]|nr:hypothetical protein [Candidatus Thermoplasmatota archaeon]
MNKEAWPLVIGILIPIILVVGVTLYFYGYDVTLYLKKIPILWYIAIIPFALGIIVALMKWMEGR